MGPKIAVSMRPAARSPPATPQRRCPLQLHSGPPRRRLRGSCWEGRRKDVANIPEWKDKRTTAWR